MPEENFEQQARMLTEGFTMEPQPAVWQHVQAAIAPKRKRRALLWWWLLPFCMAGGLSIWLKHNTARVIKDKPSASKEINAKNESEKQQGNAWNDRSKKVLQTRKAEVKYGSPADLLPGKKSRISAVNKGVLHMNKKGVTTYHWTGVLKRKEKEQNLLNDQLKTGMNTAKISTNQAALSIEKKTNPYNEYTIDSSLLFSLPDTVAVTDATASNAAAAKVMGDSVQHKKDTSAVAYHQKKKNKLSYSLGVLAELGTTSLGSPLFGANEKSSQVAGALAPSNFSDLPNNSGNATVIQSAIKDGADLSLGLSLRKELSKSIHINGQMAYRYQQFNISQTAFLDTTALNSTAGAATGRGVFYHTNATERLHFANIYTGIGWQFVTKKRLSLSLQAGVDNSLLLSVSQKQNGQPDTIKILSTRTFYQWQPFVHLSLPFEWYVGKQTRVELSPFVRFGVSRFRKNIASSKNNHLAAAGVQMIYFFK